MLNPLLDFYNANFCNDFGIKNYLKNAKSNFKFRDQAITKYSWAVPNAMALQAIAALGPIVEWYAGAGYWAYCLRQLGADIKCYTLVPGCQGESVGVIDTWSPVNKCLQTAPLAIGGRTLLLIWPPLGIGHEVLLSFKGQYVVHVGEDSGGCTSSPEFHQILAESWSLKQEICIPQWEGLHDAVYIWENSRNRSNIQDKVPK